MLKRSRYLHRQTPNGINHHGFSILLEPCDSDSVYFRLTICSINDQFCKRTARTTLDKKEQQKILIKNLPRYLQELHNECYNNKWSFTNIKDKTYGNMWAWVWKYFL